MKLVDANLLIYATLTKAPRHDAAKAWLAAAFSSEEEVRLPWSSIHAFLRLTTSGVISEAAMPLEEAVALINSWLSRANVATIEPGEDYWPILRRLVLDTPARGNLVMDAHLAALAIEHDGTVYTTDRDFRRFKGLRVINPL
ncbi:MAG TPA: TA system VapC family ribonuclease toxin [Thermoanaerobaculia bacterium]|jgi:toxin-antitoxin system PIN domain toxin|nr:TA system VapC family ribonuclease toxin [Thermoanaerobaculia bacterium]